MLINSFLVQGDGAALASGFNSFGSLDALVLLSLGSDIAKVVDKVGKAGISCPVYLAETYGIIGYDNELGRNIELMEKGRGQEYGYRGGSGGQGCLAVGFSDGAIAGHESSFPSGVSSLMVIADTSGEFAKVSSEAPVHYGGIAKEAWVVTPENGSLEKVPYFWIANKENSSPIGVSAFTGDASQATVSLAAKTPENFKVSSDVGLFPCYTRGVNHYGAENVEVNAIEQVMKQNSPPRLYGMFAHGELGPSSFSGFPSSAEQIDCTKHSMTSILAIHTVAKESLN